MFCKRCGTNLEEPVPPPDRRRMLWLAALGVILIAVAFVGGQALRAHKAPAGPTDAPPAPQPVPAPVADDDEDTASGGETLEPLALNQDAFGTTVELVVGQELEVSLQANDTTAFSWRCTVEPEGTLEMMEDRYDPDPNPDQAAGTGGTQVYLLRGVESGEATVTLQYGIWDQGAEDTPVQTRAGAITVNVGRGM